jgi:hypothetical protein
MINENFVNIIIIIIIAYYTLYTGISVMESVPFCIIDIHIDTDYSA